MGLVFMRIFLIALFLVAFGFVACDDSGTSSTEQNADTEQVSSSSVNLTVEQESSSSVVPNDTKQSSSSEKDVEYLVTDYLSELSLELNCSGLIINSFEYSCFPGKKFVKDEILTILVENNEDIYWVVDPTL